jgi:hypothetical protein
MNCFVWVYLSRGKDVGMKAFIFALICFLPVVSSDAGIITVDDDGPADFNNIQDAINFSENGDSIVVEPGTYYENIVFNGKAITLTGTYPDDPNVIGSTIITTISGYSVSFDANEAGDSVLKGFTVTGRGIYCYGGSSPTITKNIIRNCGTWGIYGEANAYGVDTAAPLISENTISGNRGGIAYCQGPVFGNIISENIFNLSDSAGGGGLSFCDGKISDNIITYNYSVFKGGACYECNGEISNNIIIGNSSVIAGGGLCTCHGEIYNNIIAGNRCDTSGGGLFSCSNIYNNTIVGNFARNRGGALGQCLGVLKNNIIAYNRAGDIGGISGYAENTYNCFWANKRGDAGDGAVISLTDIIDKPEFADNVGWDTNGTITDETDDFWVNGDYHLKSEAGRWDPNQQKWVQDDFTSPCIDAGDPNSALVAELWPHGNRVNIGAYGNTTQASWSLSDVGNIADLNYDGWVDYEDMALLTGKWLWQKVLLSEDIDRDGQVDMVDLAVLLANWRKRPLAPRPDPMAWEMEPTAASPTAIVMVAVVAASTDNSGVEYYFKCDTPGGHDSGWQDGPGYTDAPLTPDTSYFYRVKARNKTDLVETEYSQARSATTLPVDTTPPAPNPAQWQTEPYPVPPSSIRMVAATASDPSGVEYYFRCVTNPLYSSNWQDSPEYVATSLPKGTYRFVVKARDKSINLNTTSESSEVIVDLQPPSPDPMQWASGGEPDEVYRGGGNLNGYWAVMTAAQATDSSGDVEYYFLCTTESRFSSIWQSSPTYEVQIGRSGQYMEFRVKARDIYGNETVYSPELPAL